MLPCGCLSCQAFEGNFNVRKKKIDFSSYNLKKVSIIRLY